MPPEEDQARAIMQRAQKTSEFRPCGFRVTGADRQTNKPANHNTLHPYWGDVIISRYCGHGRSRLTNTSAVGGRVHHSDESFNRFCMALASPITLLCCCLRTLYSILSSLLALLWTGHGSRCKQMIRGSCDSVLSELWRCFPVETTEIMDYISVAYG